MRPLFAESARQKPSDAPSRTGNSVPRTVAKTSEQGEAPVLSKEYGTLNEIDNNNIVKEDRSSTGSKGTTSGQDKNKTVAGNTSPKTGDLARTDIKDRQTSLRSASIAKSRPGLFSFQSSASRFLYAPLHTENNTTVPGVTPSHSRNPSISADHSFPSMHRRMETADWTSNAPKTNGYPKGTQPNPIGISTNGYGRPQNGVSGLSTPSTDSFQNSPLMSPNDMHSYTVNTRDDVISICSSDSFSSERFYINENVDMTPTSSVQSLAGSDNDEHPFFSGLKDVRNPDSLQEMKIVSARGTIRGIKNRVRGGIVTFVKTNDGKAEKNYRVLEKDRVVLYTTSMMIIRDTYENCKKVRNILQTHMVEHEDRDIFMSRENQKELQERLGNSAVDVPQVFIDGQHLGGAEEILSMNETGELRRIFRNYKKTCHDNSCERCGGYRFIPCLACRGSRKSSHRNNFTEEFSALRCTICDENGLIRCDLCNTAPVEPAPPEHSSKLTATDYIRSVSTQDMRL